MADRHPHDKADQIAQPPAKCACEEKGIPDGYVCGDPSCPRTADAERAVKGIISAVLKGICE